MNNYSTTAPFTSITDSSLGMTKLNDAFSDPLSFSKHNLVKQDVEEEIQKYVQKEDFQSLSYASQIKALDEFVTKLKTMYDTTFKLDVNSTILDDIIEPLQKEAQSNLGGKSISQEVEERIQKEYMYKSDDRYDSDSFFQYLMQLPPF